MIPPHIKPFSEIVASDFEEHPVWVSCHSVDYDEPWYDEVDEEACRPWTGSLPVDPEEDMYLVRASCTLADGSVHAGFLTPSVEADMGTMQPHMFADNQRYGFWGGMLGVPKRERKKFYKLLGLKAKSVFPIHMEADSKLASGLVAVKVEGFYKMPEDDVKIEQ